MMPICQRQTKNVTCVAQRLFKSIVIWFVYVRDRKINSTVVFREKILDEFLTIQRF